MKDLKFKLIYEDRQLNELDTKEITAASHKEAVIQRNAEVEKCKLEDLFWIRIVEMK